MVVMVLLFHSNNAHNFYKTKQRYRSLLSAHKDQNQRLLNQYLRCGFHLKSSKRLLSLFWFDNVLVELTYGWAIICSLR